MSKRTPILTIAAILTLTSLAAANGLNLNGLGTRAQAMGGAFVGVADDFSAVFWNPAGAAGFRQPTFGFNAFDLMPSATYRFQSEISIPEVSGIAAKTQIAHYLGWQAAYYKPISSRIVLGLGIGTPSGIGALWDGQDFVRMMDGTAYEWSSKVGLISISPLVAVRLSEAISVGATFNLNYGTFSLKMPGGGAYVDYPPETYVDLGQYEENMTGWGVGATFGMLVKPSEKLGLGLTVRTPSTVSFNGSASLPYLSLYELPGSSDLKRKITWPLWIAAGVSFQPVPRLLLSADVHWTQWSKLDRITTEYLDTAWASFFASGGLDVLGVHVFQWNDKAQFRFGAEYTLNASTALRAGYYHDPAPAPDNRLNILFPSHTFNAFTFGAGKTIGDLRLDFGLEYLAGNGRTVEDLFGGSETYGMKIIVPTFSVSYKF